MAREVVQAAVWYFTRGFAVVPLFHRLKHPIDKAWNEHRASTLAEVRETFAWASGILVITGTDSNVVVIDADNAEAVAWVEKNLPLTSWKVRTRRGVHFYYRHPGVAISTRQIREDGLVLEVNGDGGWVVSPPTFTRANPKRGIKAHTYHFEGKPGPCDQLPVFDPRWLPAQPVAQQLHRASAREVVDVDWVKRAPLYLAKVARPVVGMRSDMLTFQRACRLVRGFDLPAETATDLLVEWSGFGAGWVASKVRSALAHGTEPMGRLRHPTPRT